VQHSSFSDLLRKLRRYRSETFCVHTGADRRFQIWFVRGLSQDQELASDGPERSNVQAEFKRWRRPIPKKRDFFEAQVRQ